MGNRYCRNGTEENEVVEDFVTGTNASVGFLYEASRCKHSGGRLGRVKLDT